MSQTEVTPLHQRVETIRQQYEAIQGESACTPPEKADAYYLLSVLDMDTAAGLPQDPLQIVAKGQLSLEPLNIQLKLD